MCATPPSAHDNPAALPAAGLQWIAFTAPGTAASALKAAGLWSLDAAPRRFDAEDWWFRTRFTAPACGATEKLVLGFDGLATLADVWLDNELLLTSDNMFVAHERNIPAAGDHHELVIRCRALDTALAVRRARPRWKTPMMEHQQLRWFRTTVLGRTPGWSAPAAAVGPWRDVWIETRAPLGIDAIDVDAQLVNGTGVVTVKGQLADSGGAGQLQLVVTRGKQKWTTPLTCLDDHTFRASIPIENPDLWWPHTHGEPALYEVALCSTPQAGTAALEVDLGTTGFRTVELMQEDGGFELRINGERIFCRGACWTPLDQVTLSSDGAACQTALEQVRDAGMNMLRVSGTTIYESDAFLDACDALGILVWQDLMFANMDYPDENAAFLESARVEARQQLSRMAARPALTVICGNSEGEQQAAMWGAPRERWSPRLFHEVIPQIAASVCPGVPYWPSSAHGGAFPHQPNSGTTSYYGVGAYLRPLEDARRSELRFATECLAFANVPEESSIAKMPGGFTLRVHHPQWKARAPRDLGAGWDFEDVRDFYLQYMFGVDPLKLRYSDHDRYLQLSRVVTGEVMAAAFGEWRRGKSTCNGALVWFLKDLWMGAGWGIIAADQQPKAPYYYLSRALQPLAVTLSDEGLNGLYVHLINERATRFCGCLELAAYKDGTVLVNRISQPIDIAARKTLEIPALQASEAFADFSYAFRFGPPAHDVIVARLLDADGTEHAHTFHFPLGIDLPKTGDAGLAASARMQSDGSALLTIATKRFAQCVTVAAEGYAAQDQYFHVAPDRERIIRLRPLRGDVKLRGVVQAFNTDTVAKIEIVE